MGAGVDMRLGPQPQLQRGGEHHRGEQHHGGVQAQHGGDCRADREHQPEQDHRAATGAGGHALPGGLEEPLAVAQLGQHQHRGQEPDSRPEAAKLLPGHLDREDAQEHGEQGGRDRHHRLREAAGANHREGERGRK